MHLFSGRPPCSVTVVCFRTRYKCTYLLTVYYDSTETWVNLGARIKGPNWGSGGGKPQWDLGSKPRMRYVYVLTFSVVIVVFYCFMHFIN